MEKDLLEVEQKHLENVLKECNPEQLEDIEKEICTSLHL